MGFELFRRYGSRLCRQWSVIGCAMEYMGSALDRIACWSLLNSWPRAGAKPMGNVDSLPLTVLDRVETVEEARSCAWSAGFNFHPPLTATFIPFGKGSPEGAVIHLAVSHMLSDGYCVVPILDDLAFLVARAEARLSGMPGESLASSLGNSS